jgi:hypothetical protein
MTAKPLPTVRVADIQDEPEDRRWLVRPLWGRCAVGVLGGPPKACKSWLGLDMAVSVASGTACLGRFEVEQKGPVLVYLAEDALAEVRGRIDQLCRHRDLPLSGLDLFVVTVPGLRLDRERDREALDATLETLRPRLLLLDPLVRLHRLDENSAAEISGLLGFLREINRRHEVALLLVHHMSKKARADPGQALRGSGDLHAWTDSACYLVRRPGGQIRMTVEHRAAPAPEPILLRLVDDDGPVRLEVAGGEDAPAPLAEAVRTALRQADRPCSRAELRRELRVNNARLGGTLAEMERRGLARRGEQGWTLGKQASSGQPPSPQLSLLP